MEEILRSWNQRWPLLQGEGVAGRIIKTLAEIETTGTEVGIQVKGENRRNSDWGMSGWSSVGCYGPVILSQGRASSGNKSCFYLLWIQKPVHIKWDYIFDSLCRVDGKTVGNLIAFEPDSFCLVLLRSYSKSSSVSPQSNGWDLTIVSPMKKQNTTCLDVAIAFIHIITATADLICYTTVFLMCLHWVADLNHFWENAPNLLWGRADLHCRKQHCSC